MADRRTVAVLMGGPSAERDVSIRSGTAVAHGLRQAGHGVVEVAVVGRDVEIPREAEVVFIALHGEFGEDGTVQALLDEKGIAYTGSGAESSRMAFDKILTKEALSSRGIPTPKYEVLRSADTPRMPPPVVIKPACQGSSIGVHRVRAEGDVAAAVSDALMYGSRVVAEEYIEGKELTVGILDGDPLPMIEISAPDAWYDYGAKYTSGVCEYRVPAPVGDELIRLGQDLAVATYECLGCRGYGRVDFRANGNGNLYVLEINTIPGFTETSLLPKAAAKAGIEFPELCSRILETARTG